MTRSDKILLRNDILGKLPESERLIIVETLIRHLIDNEINHIWTAVKVMLVGMFTICGLLLKHVL